MYGKMKAPGLTEFTPFLCTSAIWGQSCFLVHLASCKAAYSAASQQSLWAPAGSLFEEPSFTFPLEKGKYPFQYSGLENSMDCIVNGVAKESDTAK